MIHVHQLYRQYQQLTSSDSLWDVLSAWLSGSCGGSEAGEGSGDDVPERSMSMRREKKLIRSAAGMRVGVEVGWVVRGKKMATNESLCVADITLGGGV